LALGKNDILLALYNNRQGLGHNELRNEGINPSNLHKWLSPKNPQLVHEGLVRIEKTKVKGGMKKLHFLTQKGIDYMNRHVTGSQYLKRFFKVYDAATPSEKLQGLEKIYQDLFKLAYDQLINENRSEFLRGLNDVQVLAIIDLLNEAWISKKDVLSEHIKNREEILKRIGETETVLDRFEFSGEYVFQYVRRRQYPLEFIIEDGKAAWNNGHYLNRHHRYVLEKLGLHSKEEIKEKNSAWLAKHDGIAKNSTQHKNIVRGEIRERLTDLRNQIESLPPKQKGGKITMQDGKEYEIKEPSEKYKALPNWMLRLKNGDFNSYGDSLWDVS
jgi:hypothetical protein